MNSSCSFQGYYRKTVRLILVAAFLLFGGCGLLFCQAPFTCQGQVFLTLEGSNELVEAIISPGNNSLQISPIGNPGVSLHTLGFRSTDRLLYGIGTLDLHLYQIDANGTAKDLGKPALDASLFYLAGDVSPDGKYFLAVGSDNNGIDKQLARINLESSGFETEMFNFSTQTRLSDIAYDPYTSQLFGYDRISRSVISFAIGSSAATGFQILNSGNELYGMHFDAFGNLFSVGSTAFGVTNALFSIDKTTGKERVLTNGPPYAIADGASCPYTVKINNQAVPEASFPCSEIEYTYAIANNTGQILNGIDLEHALPPGFSFKSILQNPLGTVPDPAALPDVLRFKNATLLKGVSQLTIKVEIADIAGGKYASQARMDKLPGYLGSFRLSDAPLSVAYEDSTLVEVNRFEEDSLFFSWFLCHGKTMILDASDYGNNIQWNTGSKELKLEVSQGGTYTLEAASGCQTLFVSHEVTSATCPYTIAIDHKILPDTTFSCSELIYRFIFENDSGEKRTGLNFTDTLPEGFNFLAVLGNPYGGTVKSTFPSKEIHIASMSLKTGFDTLDLLVEVGNIPPGNYENRAMINSLPPVLGPTRLSDNPKTIALDATPVHVLGVDADTLYVDKIICNGSDLVLDAGEYGVNHLWEDGSTGNQFTVTAPGTYKVTIFDGCAPSVVYFTVSEGTFIEAVFPEPVVGIHLGEEYQLAPVILNNSDSLFIEWTDPLNSTLSCYDCPAPVAMPLQNVRYTILISNEICSDTAVVQIDVDNTRRIYAPNVFSPNADGINDYFYLQSPDHGIIRSLVVFDRWSDVVFESSQSSLNAPPSGWDGRRKGRVLPIGVYLWQASVTFLDGKTETLSGEVLLLK
jgi:gliding motility-associated-like protein